MNQDKTIILACSSLTEYVEAAQARAGTKMQVRYLNRIYHRDPAEMQEHIKAELERMPEEIDTVLVCMGFCGGSWNQVQSRYRLVIPRVDDCVSLLLQTKDDPVSNLKTPGHLYVRAMDPSTESFKAIFERLVKAYNVDEETAEKRHKEWMDLYNTISVMDTGIQRWNTWRPASIFWKNCLAESGTISSWFSNRAAPFKKKKCWFRISENI